MADSKKFADKIKELERQGKELLRKDWESEQSLSASIRVGDTPPILSKLNSSADAVTTTRAKDGGSSHISLPSYSQTGLSTDSLVRSLTQPLTGYHSTAGSPTKAPPTSFSSAQLSRPRSLSQSFSTGNITNADKLQNDRQIRQATVTIEDLKEQLRRAQKLSDEHKKQFRVSNEELAKRLQDAVVERDRLAAARVTVANGQEELIRSLQTAVTELQQTTDSQMQTIADTERQLHALQLVKSDYDNMVDLLRGVVKSHRKGNATVYYDSEPISSQSTAMLIHSLERCITDGEKDNRYNLTKISELEHKVSDLELASHSVEKTTTKHLEEKHERIRKDLEERLLAADERATNARSQSESLTQQLSLAQEQYKGSELLREEQTRILEERVDLLKSQIDGERKDSQTKLESVSVALDSTQRDLTDTLSTKDELVRKYAGLEEKVKDYEVLVEKLNAELELEKEQSKKLWEKDNEILNRNVEIETKMALRDAEMARLEALLEKTKDECSKQIKQEVELAQKYQQDKFSEEKTILVKQVDSLTLRHTKVSSELQLLQVDCAKLRSQLQHAQEKLAQVEGLQVKTSEDKESLQGQLIIKNEQIDKVTSERDQFVNMLEQRNKQFGEISLACERSNMQREERERHLETLESTAARLEDRLSQAHHELSNYQQENATLHRTRDEFDSRIREMEMAVEKQTKKLKSKDKKIADAESERDRLDELLAHKSDTIIQLEDQIRCNENSLKDAKREISMLSEESSALKSVMKGQEGEMQREINNLLIKLKAVEQDYKLAKKALKSKEHVDKQASNMANNLQTELTDQRKYSDELRSKIRWMEDELDASKKDKLGVEEQCEQLQVELEHRCKAEQRLQQMLVTETSKSSMLQSKVVSLEDGLKETISRCSALQASAEHSEQNLYKLKLKHQLELKEMQRNTGEQVIVPPAPMSPPKPQQDDGLATELKTVLKDMKSLLSSAQERKVYEKRKSCRASDRSDVSALSQSDGAAHDHPHSERSSRHRRGRESSGSLESLLMPTDLLSDRGDARDSTPRHTQGDSAKTHSKHRSKSHRKVSEPLKTEAEILCKNLEKKLQHLTKLGEQSTRSSSRFIGSGQAPPPSTSYEKLHKYLRAQKS